MKKNETRYLEEKKCVEFTFKMSMLYVKDFCLLFLSMKWNLSSFFFFFSVNKYHDLGFDVLSFVEGNDYFLVKI